MDDEIAIHRGTADDHRHSLAYVASLTISLLSHLIDRRDHSSNPRPSGSQRTRRVGTGELALYFVKEKRAQCVIPSRSVKMKSRQVPAHDFAVVAKNV